MRKSIAVLLCAAFCSTAVFAVGLDKVSDDPETITFSVEGMMCEACPPQLQSYVEELDGVVEADASLEDQQLVVVYDPAVIAPDEIIAAVGENTDFSLAYIAEDEDDEEIEIDVETGEE